MKLADLSNFIRSKNAGPFSLTFDILFGEEAAYRRVRDSGAISPAMVAAAYGCPQDKVRIFHCDPILAIKVSIPRPVFQGELDDADMLGGQQYAPFLDLEIPG